MTPRGIRLNNPGNIRKSATDWAGQVTPGDDDQYVTFSAPVYGLRALAKILLNYRRLYGLDNVDAIISRWAPPEENDTTSYKRDVAARIGVDEAAPLNLDSDTVLMALMAAIITHENGQQPYALSVLQSAVDLARGAS